MLDALTWLSMILILCLSIYSTRSVIFIYKVTGARGNNTSHKMQKADVLSSWRGFKSASLYNHRVTTTDTRRDLDIADKASGGQINEKYPFISIFVATYNESLVIDRLLNSFVALSYPDDRFEIIIVDDSTDDTYQKI